MSNDSPAANQSEIRRLIALFALAYFAQGLSQAGGLINQPLNYYLKTGLGLSASDISEYLAILTIPWVVKPIYGLISDYIPLFGYRRRTWLMLVNLIAATGFLWLIGLKDVGTIVMALVLTAFGTAFSDVIIDALVVENGNRTGQTARFQGMQWIAFRVASILTALTGGYLASLFEPATALHLAATITMLAPIAVLTMAYLVVREEPAQMDLAELRATTRSTLAAIKSPILRISAAFLVIWCFSPAFGTPMYYHMVDVLHFDQKFIGQLMALTSVGGLIGAILFTKLLANKSVSFRATFAVISASCVILSFHLLTEPSSYASQLAPVLNVLSGAIMQIGALTIFALAAIACPPRAEAFTFAALMSLYNGAEQLSAIIGSRLYDQYFDQQLGPLLWVASGSFLICLLMLPLLRRLDKVADDDVAYEGIDAR
jgi:predicted MFS family arabinose efflux permease